jgi:C1q domain
MVLGNNASGHLFDTSFTADGILYADASGVVTSTAAGTSGQVMTSNGAGVAPTYQTSAAGGATGFMAYANATLSNVTGNGVIYNVIFNATTRNDGTCYNTGTGVFTAPSTGLYCFSTTLFLQSGTSFTAGSELLVASRGSVQSQIICLYGAAASAQVNAAIIVAGNWIVNMTAGDTINVQAYSNSTLQDVSITGSALSPNQFTTVSFFSGFKVGT